MTTGNKGQDPQETKAVFVQDPDCPEIVYRQGDPDAFIEAVKQKISEIRRELRTLNRGVSEEIKRIADEVFSLQMAIANFQIGLDRKTFRVKGDDDE